MLKRSKLIPIFGESGVTSVISDVCMDPGAISRFESLTEYLVSQNLKCDPKDLKKLIKQLEKKIQDQVFYYGCLQYHVMDLSDDWGPAGEQQVKSAFCRQIMELPANRQVTTMDVFDFMTKIDEILEDLGIKSMSLDEARGRVTNMGFELFNGYPSQAKGEFIQNVLRFVGSKKLFYIGYKGKYWRLIYADGQTKKMGNYGVITYEKETARTPNIIVALAAMLNGLEVILRMESLRAIFYQKWVPALQLSDWEGDIIKSDINRNISEGIKQKTLALYQAKTPEQLKKIESDFLVDMGETISLHELGHGIARAHYLAVGVNAMAEASVRFGENIYTALLEFFADFAPARDEIKGAVQNMVDVAKTDEQRAARMYYMYLSDTWFFDTEDTYMYIYSDIMALILTRYLKKDGQVDFKAAEGDINNEKGLMRTLADMVTHDMDEIEKMVQEATYTVVGKNWAYKDIQHSTCVNLERKGSITDRGSSKFLCAYWNQIFTFTQQASDVGEKIKAYLERREKAVLKRLLVYCAGKTVAEKYEYDHRKYVQERFRKLGILAYKQTKKQPALPRPQRRPKPR